MKEKEASPRKTSARKSSKQLVMDVNIKTQMKKHADASRAAVKDRQSDKEDAKKKEVTFADNVKEEKVGETETDPHPNDSNTPRDSNTSMESIKEEDTENPQPPLEGDAEKTPRDGEDPEATPREGEGGGVDTEMAGETGTTEDKDGEGSKESEDKKEEEDKKGKKGKKKGGKTKPKKEIKKKVVKPKPIEMPKGEVTAGTEEFRTFIFDKVQTALEIVCTDGVTDTTVDNVTPLLKALDVDTSDEGVIDLMRDALVDNFGVINPLDLDQVVQKAQEANELTEMDDCLEVAFKLIDFDEDEFITQKDIYKLGLGLGEELAEFALDEMVDAVDMDKDGKISLRDFRYFLLGRDVPSRKEIFAMAEAARKKREEEEERKRQEEEKIENERQAKLYQKIKDDEAKEMEEGEGEEKPVSDSEEGEKEEEGEGKGSDEVGVEEEKVEQEDEVKDIEEEKEEAVPKTEAELLREKRKHMFVGYAKAVTAANVIANKTGGSVQPQNGDDGGDDANGGDDNDDEKVLGGCDDTKDDSLDDDDLDFSREDLGPMSIQTSLELNLPPPDLSTVSHALLSPLTTPRGPTIVGIGGLGVSNNSHAYNDAIQKLEEDMFRGDNLVPQRPHRRRSTSASVEDMAAMNVLSQGDVDDYNNRLVYKLPPLRRPSCTPPVGAQRRDSIVSDRRPSLQHSARTNTSNKYAMATDSDEGIDLADEEIVEPTVIVPCGASAPSVSLRISLPQGHDLEGAAGYDADRMNVSIVTRKGRRRSSGSSATINIDDRGMATLGVGPYSDTPRSISRSEISATHISIMSPRLSDDEYGDDVNDDLETTTSKAAIHTASNTSGYDCDNDSIVLSLHEGDDDNANDDGDDVVDLLKAKEKLSHYKKGRLKKTKLKTETISSQDREVSPTPSLTRRKSLHSSKKSFSCQKIEIKELALNEPVPVGHFSNRHKFGMIPRDVSKFIVLGKNPTSDEAEKASTSGKEESTDTYAQPKKSATVRWQELPDMIRPVLRHNKSDRRSTVCTPAKEHNVLQGRRLSLFHDIHAPVLKNRQSFDLPILPNKIQIPTGASSSSSNVPTLDDIKKMERKILKRSQTSFELPNVYEGNSEGVQTARSDLSSRSQHSARSRPLSARHRRKSSPIATYDSDGGGRLSARNRKVSIVDLSKSLRRETACRATSSLSKKHSGFKSIVPLARVVMAYQSTKKKHRENGGFYSISRQLEKSGVPFNTNSSSFSSNPSPRRSVTDPYRLDGRKRRCRSAKGRTGSGPYGSSKGETDDLYAPLFDDDIHTLVEDFKDQDTIPADVIFQKNRPATAHAGSLRNFTNRNSNLNGSMSGSSGNIVTLEIPETNKFEKKLKNVSLLSKLPIK